MNDTNRREYQAVAYLSLKERKRLEELAKATHRSISDYVRVLILRELAEGDESE